MKKIIVSLLLSCAGCSLHLQGMENTTTTQTTAPTDLVAQFKEKYARLYELMDENSPYHNEKIDQIINSAPNANNELKTNLKRCAGDLGSNILATFQALNNAGVYVIMQKLSKNTGDKTALETELKSKITDQLISSLDRPFHFKKLVDTAIVELQYAPQTTTKQSSEGDINKTTYEVPHLTIAPITGIFNRIRNLVWPSIRTLNTIKSTITVTRKADSSEFEVKNGQTITQGNNLQDLIKKEEIRSFNERTLRHNTAANRSVRLSLLSAGPIGVGTYKLFSKLNIPQPKALAFVAAGAGFYFLCTPLYRYINNLLKRSAKTNPIVQANKTSLRNYNNYFSSDLPRKILNNFGDGTVE